MDGDNVLVVLRFEAFASVWMCVRWVEFDWYVRVVACAVDDVVDVVQRFWVNVSTVYVPSLGLACVPRYVPCMPPDASLTVLPQTPATSGTISQKPDSRCGHNCAATSGAPTAVEGAGSKFQDGGIFGYASFDSRCILASRYS